MSIYKIYISFLNIGRLWAQDWSHHFQFKSNSATSQGLAPAFTIFSFLHSEGCWGSIPLPLPTAWPRLNSAGACRASSRLTTRLFLTPWLICHSNLVSDLSPCPSLLSPSLGSHDEGLLIRGMSGCLFLGPSPAWLLPGPLCFQITVSAAFPALGNLSP